MSMLLHSEENHLVHCSDMILVRTQTFPPKKKKKRKPQPIAKVAKEVHTEISACRKRL